MKFLPRATIGAEEITAFGGWRAWLAHQGGMAPISNSLPPEGGPQGGVVRA